MDRPALRRREMPDHKGFPEDMEEIAEKHAC